MGRIARKKRIDLRIVLGCFCAFAFCAALAHAQEKTKKEYQFEGSKIEGEREKPRDLYILPWQATKPLSESKSEIEFLTGFEEVKDRDQVRQENEYFHRVGVKAQ